MSSFYDVILNDEEEDLRSRKNIDKWIFRLLLLLLGVMPLIVLASKFFIINSIATLKLTNGYSVRKLFLYKEANIPIFCLISDILPIN